MSFYDIVIKYLYSTNPFEYDRLSTVNEAGETVIIEFEKRDKDIKRY
jgi:hypothetical protein